jgi:hypothetical protein
MADDNLENRTTGPAETLNVRHEIRAEYRDEFNSGSDLGNSFNISSACLNQNETSFKN